MNRENLGKGIKHARLNLNYSLRAVAKQLGLSHGYFSKVERGKCAPPSEETLVKIAKLLQINSDLILTTAGKIPSDITDGLLKYPDIILDTRRTISDRDSQANN